MRRSYREIEDDIVKSVSNDRNVSINDVSETLDVPFKFLINITRNFRIRYLFCLFAVEVGVVDVGVGAGLLEEVFP